MCDGLIVCPLPAAAAGECAVLVANQGLVVGSQDATTCVVAIVGCPLTRLVWVAHLDDMQLGSADVQRLADALQQMRQPELYMAGGYSEPAGRGPSESRVCGGGGGVYACPQKHPI